MGATDAKFVPIKNAAYRVTFPIFDADGDLVTGATGLDSEVSIDAGAFADCTNEATEIATSSGMYYLDLTASEMNGDTIAIIVKTTSVGAKTTPIVLITAARDVDDLAYPTTSGRSIDVTATGEVGLDFANTAGTLDSSDITSVGAVATGGITAASFAAGAIDAAAIATDAIGSAELAATAVTEIQSGLATSAALSTVDTNVSAILADTGTDGVIVVTNNDKTGYRLSATGIDDILDESLTELAAVPAAAPTLRAAMQFLFMALRNKITTTATQTKIYNDAGSAIGTASVSDDGATFTRDEFV